MAGKNHLLRWTRLYVGGYNLSGDSRAYSSLDNHYEPANLGGFSDAVRVYLAGSQRITGVRGYKALLDDATAGAFTRLKMTAGSLNQSQLSILFGGGAEPAIGDPAYLLPSCQMSDSADFDGLAAAINCDFLPDVGQITALIDNPNGKVLYPETSLAATTNGASINNGASSANGGYALLHLVASSGGTWVLKVQHSVNDSAWSDLITFSANGSAITSELGTASGTIDQYVRFQATRTSGTLTPVVTFVRN